MTPLVSVIIPVYNGEQYIAECIESILKQTYAHQEIIVVDDASTDRSVEILKSYRDSRILLIRNEINLGLAASVNHAIRKSNGAYIARMDADDIASPLRIAKQVDFLTKHTDVSILGTAMRSFGYGRYLHTFPVTHAACKPRLLFNVCFGHPTVMFRRGVFDDPTSFYTETLRQFSEEYDLWCRLVNRYTFANLPEVLLQYRTFPPQQKNDAEKKRRANSFIIRKQFIRSEWGSMSEEFFHFHDHLCHVDKAKNLNEFNEWLQWLKKMEILNSERPGFSALELKKELKARMFELYYWNTHLGFKQWQKWITENNGGYRPSIVQQLNFFYKSVFRK
jgi:glycosyltransferase involved in cell wall biosynthesis